jgi:signal transduction histidine kinase
MNRWSPSRPEVASVAKPIGCVLRRIVRAVGAVLEAACGSAAGEGAGVLDTLPRSRWYGLASGFIPREGRDPTLEQRRDPLRVGTGDRSSSDRPPRPRRGLCAWGAMTVSSTEGPLPPGTEARLASFTELVATAIANAEGKSELAASRRRIVAASDEARRRIERDLHDGTQQQLVSLGLAVRAAEANLPPERDDLRAQLSGVAAGLVAAKHSQASRIDVSLEQRDGRLVLSIGDDGVGGADAGGGSGLVGLTDRVEALGGRFALESPPRRGATISVELPIAKPATL